MTETGERLPQDAIRASATYVNDRNWRKTDRAEETDNRTDSYAKPAINCGRHRVTMSEHTAPSIPRRTSLILHFSRHLSLHCGYTRLAETGG